MGTRSKACINSSVLLLIASLNLHLSIASDNISPGQSLSGNQTLISEGGFFELGFFTPGNNSRNHYIGIWYKRGSNETKRVVWVANRDSPLSEPSSSELRFVEDGNLVLFNQLQNSVVWSTNSTSNTLNSSLVVLGDDGNLVIRSRRDPFSVSWQSFDYPTDTWLPGQKFGVNKVTGLSHILTSWKSPDDPSPGNYSLELDRNGRAQYFIMWNARRYWASGEWNGQVFSSIPEMRLGSGLYNLSYVSNETEGYFIYNLLEESISMKFALDPSGQFKLSGWMDNDPSWRFLWSQPREQCNVYNYCGAFSRCNQNVSSSCGCLPGFQLVRDWVENNYRCSRRIQLQCVNRTVIGETDKFLKIPQTTFPVDQQSSLVTTQGCESACLQNCSCTAYAYSNGQCSIWAGDLLNVRPRSQGDIGGGDLYLKVAASEMGIPEENTTTSTERNETSTPERQLSLIIALPVALTVLVSSFLACLLWKRKLVQKGERQRSQDLLLFDIAIQSETRDATVSLKGEKEDADLPLFSFASVCAATSNFSSANKLGQGGFGIVYKGKLIKGQEVAVKRLSMGSGQGIQELRNETLLIAKLQHRNLVRLLGCCLEGEEKILVYEYMSNNSLDTFIFDPIKRNELDWGKRAHIIEGIAQGLLYLHQYSRVRIIHRDMKPSNILLDSDMNPKISDFGMARIFGGNNSQANTNRIVGTYGYMPPEYAMEGLFSVKSDVFSFGVLVLEIVSGKKNTGFYLAEFRNLLDHSWNLWKNDKGLELLDPVLGEPSSISTPLRYIHVALLCVQDNPVDRPTMSGVITMLSNESMILPFPKHPAFVTGRSVEGGNSPENKPRIHSINGVTYSMMEGR